jgi:hypothetical protein
VNAPTIFRQHRTARWLIPVGVVSVLGAAAVAILNSSSGSSRLPSKTAAELLADVRAAAATAVSGTVIVQLAPGSSELPRLMSADDSDRTLAGLVGGSHAIRFWYAGPDRQRVAVLEGDAETDVFRSGRDVWQWDSDERVAVHTTLPRWADPAMPVSPALPQQLAGLMPQPLAAGVLAAVDADTATSVAEPRIVADRAAYQLVVTPHDTATRVASVRIAVDAVTRVPLAIEIYARGVKAPVVDVAFVSITFRRPPAAVFKPPHAEALHRLGSSGVEGPVSVRGSGWAAVVEYRMQGAAGVAVTSDPFVQSFSPVRGEWGRGRLLDTTLVCVLITHEGRVYAGAVEPTVLYAAAARR